MNMWKERQDGNPANLQKLGIDPKQQTFPNLKYPRTKFVFYDYQSSPLAMIKNPFLCFPPHLLVSPTLLCGHKIFPVQTFILKGKECRVLPAAGFIGQKVWNQFCVTSDSVWQVSAPK